MCEPATDHGASGPAAWARAIARQTGERPVCGAPGTPWSEVLDRAIKRDAGWLVVAYGSPGFPLPQSCARHERLARLVGQAPCPVLTLQPWVGASAARLETAVVGVNASPKARAAALAAARLVSSVGGRGRLILAHGSEDHPAELAAHTPWPELTERMRPERHAWIDELARELTARVLAVDIAVQLTWAPELVAGLARRHAADFVALGAGRCSEGVSKQLDRIHVQVLRESPCPLLMAAARRDGRSPAPVA